ncbi:GntR family transcriptional regulator [Paracoccus sp. (in: a-proteobacteria)]|uniref:GntR family transcriptional regulator n=1 Tax=Paracoccus sp. TaxID=267 RepID=UPI003A8674F4
MATLSETAYAALRRDIISGRLEPGQPLRMTFLCQRYDMGMSPLREALSRLQAEGLVISYALRGFTVAPLSQQELADNTETRILIESEALRRAIERGDDAWEAGIVAALHSLLLQARRVEGDDPDEIEKLEDRHFEFHRALVSACGSRHLMEFFQTLYSEADRYRYRSLVNPRRRNFGDRQHEHQEIADAVLARDTARAVALLATHYRKTAEALQAHFMAEAAE